MPIAITPLSSSRFTRATAAVAALAIVVTGLTVGGVAPTAIAATGTVSGTVFRDFNSNGVRNTGAAARSGIANDIGLAGVTIKAYDRDNVERGTTISGADGTYTLTATDTASDAIRVEFTGIPTGYLPTSAGTSNGTTVQFTTVGATGVNLGVNAAEDYSKSAAPIVTAIQYSGSPIAGVGTTLTRDQPALVATPYATNFTAVPATAYPDRVTLATFGQVGAVWGTAYRAKSNALYAAATYKRHAGLGTLGLGGIYRVNNVTTAAGAGNTAATVTPWLDVTSLGINVGTAQTNEARGLTTAQTPAQDVDAFARAGKIGIGAITLSADGNTLYFVNLFDKKLYALDITNQSAPTLKSKIDLGLTTGQRPWALTISRGSFYVGYVTTGETLVGGVETPNPGVAAATAGLTANVITAPLSNTSTWTQVLTGNALDYAKGDVYGNTLVPQSHRWNTWTDTWDWTAAASSSGVAGSVGQPTGGWQIYPEPVLTSLYFDAGGYLSLGFSDRNAIQGGNRNYAAKAGTNTFETGASGDLLIAAPAADGKYALERDGKAGTRTSVVTPANAEGPGTSEFYNDRLNVGAGTTHREVTLGALAGIKGTGEVVSTEYDPLSGIRLSGLGWLSTSNGAALAGYEHTTDPGGSTAPGAVGTFQKGGGLGSVQLLAQQAPIEIGNRAWFDADQDGIQDADEPALPGVIVQLLQGTTVIGTRTTDANGNYYFSSDTSSPNYSTSDTPGAFVAYGGDYTVKFIKPTGNVAFTGATATTFGTIPWSAVSLTARAAGTDTTVDSNPSATTGEYVYTAGAPGVDDHTIDVGYTANASYTIQKLISPAGGTPATGQQFSIKATATNFRGVSTEATSTLTANQTSSAVSVPAGTKVQVTENGSGDYRTATVSPSASTLVTVGTPFAFTVTNELHKPGRFSISKSVTGPVASAVASTQEFHVKFTYPGLPTPGDLVVRNDGTVVTSTAIPFGTVVTLSEDAPTGAPAQVEWQTPTWSGTGVTDNGNGTASVTIGDDTTLAVSLTNPTTRITGGFSVSKVIGADAASSVPANFQFTVQYSVDNGTTWSNLTVTKNAPTAAAASIPAGTTVLIREVAPGTAAADVEFGTPVFSGTGVTTTAGVTSFTITPNGTTAITLTNPTTRLYGTFAVTKNVTGGAKSQVAAGTKFTVKYTYSGQATAGSFEVADGQVFTSEDIPRGTAVTITEVTPTGGLPAGSSWGTPVLKIGGSTVANGSQVTITKGIVAVTLENPTTVTAAIDIEKGDGSGTSISNDADSMSSGQFYAPGSSRTIVFRVVNTGTDELRDLTLSDAGISGGTVTTLKWTLPNGTVLDAVPGTGTSAFTTGTFKPGEVITGTATLVVAASAAPHVDRAAVTATGVASGTKVSDSDDYNAFSGGIQVIKYDGEKADPAVKDASGNWIIPSKASVSASQNADTTASAVQYPVDTPKKVRWVVTNTGTTALTNLRVDDVTIDGAKIGSGWTADLTPINGPSEYSFVTDGEWHGVFPAGASFFAEGTLTLGASATHTDSVQAVAMVVEPAVDGTGAPTGAPRLDSSGKPVLALNGTSPIRVFDVDRFTAKTGVGPFIDIEKGDGSGTTISRDADTMADGRVYAAGDSRTIVFRVTNAGDEDLRKISLRDVLVSGGDIADLKWTLPNGTVLDAVAGTATQWSGTFTGNETFKPGEVITGTATLTVSASAAPHVDRALVTAEGVDSSKVVTDTDFYNAYSGAIQVIKYDGQAADPAVKDASGNWITPTKAAVTAARDADTTGTAVEYPVDTPRTVRWVVTNTGSTTLTDLTLADITGAGATIGSDWTADLSPLGGDPEYSFVDDGPWNGAFAPGASFFAEGTLTLGANDTHTDTVTAVGAIAVPAVNAADGTPTGAPSLDAFGDPIASTNAAGNPLTVTDDDSFNAFTKAAPSIDIEKGDGTGTAITHDADTIDGAQVYAAGTTRTVVLRVTNSGGENLRDVRLNDVTVSGAAVTDLKWTLPDGTVLNATPGTATDWAGTFGSGTATFAPGEVITGTATLTLTLSGQAHVDRATVTAKGAASGTAVSDADSYNAFTGGIQVIKYDGEKADPAVQDADGDWIIPTKAGVAAAQNADTAANAVEYPVDTPRTVRWVVTNTGTTSLTNLTLEDITNNGPAVGDDWTADLSPIGGDPEYSFTDSGAWTGVFAPGTSFFAEGTLAIGANATHSDTVTAVAEIVTPAVTGTGVPTGAPQLDSAGHPVVAIVGGSPFEVTDNDPFTAKAGKGAFIDIEKGDGTDTTIENDADTMADGQVYPAGTSRTVVFRVENTGDETLRDVKLTDTIVSGGAVTGLEWTLPNGSKLPATVGTTTTWAGPFAPGAVITGKATVTVSASDQPHVDKATVEATGSASGKKVTDSDAYNAYTGSVQVIKYDGSKGDPAVKNAAGDWIIPSKADVDAAQDADTSATAVNFPVDTPRAVRWVVTNTGSTTLTNITLADVTNAGPAIADGWTADLSGIGGPVDYDFADGAWNGAFAPGTSFFAEGTLTLAASETHTDTVTVVGEIAVPAVDPATGAPTGLPSVNADGEPLAATDADGEAITVTDNDPFTAVAGVGPIVSIEKGDGTGTTIDHNANSMDGGQFYAPGSSRTIVFRVENTGDEDLREVELADAGISGGTVTALEWTLPDGTTLPATVGTPTKWTATFAAGTAVFEPGQVITGTAQLTVALGDKPHVDRASVSAVGAASGKPVSDDNDYNAFTGAVQVIKYDGSKADPAVQDATGNWIVPSKSDMDIAQDADVADDAVTYPVDTARKVRWVVTNTGTTSLTNLTLEDVTSDGPDVGADWTADLSPIGGPSDYSFVDDGSWTGVFAPGTSFFAEGTLELGASDTHADTVTVVGEVVTPAVSGTGVPNGLPSLDADGDPIVATDASGDPVTVTDDDPFTAKTGVGPSVDIEKGDGNGTTIVHDADTMKRGEVYAAGTSRTIVFRVTNTGDEDLRNVVLTDKSISGGKVSDLTWTFPDGSTAKAKTVRGVLTASWAATVSGTTKWLPGQIITGSATLTVSMSDDPHVDTATVTAVGADSSKNVTDADNYNAFTGGIQVIKYAGDRDDPKVKTLRGDWIVPTKESFDPNEDADTPDAAVVVDPNGKQKIRWVVTNVGKTYLTAIDVADITGMGPSVGDTWTADLSGIGGPSKYSFVKSGTWRGLFAPGESFFAEGELTMGQLDAHADIVKVLAKVVVPAVDPQTGMPTGDPMVTPVGEPEVGQTSDGKPYTVRDDDPFNAITPSIAEQAEDAISGNLPHTGLEVQVSLLLAFLMLLGGGALLFFAPRRRKH